MVNYSKISSFFELYRILSIDVVIGALSVGVMAVKVLDVQMNFVWWLILALSVWIIYTADHLIDANKVKSNAFSKRRLFYYKHFNLIFVLTLSILLLTVFLSIVFFSRIVVYFGICLGLFVTLYLIIVRFIGSISSIWMQKELIVAFIYTTGIWGIPVLMSQSTPGLSQSLIIISFFLIVWADILLIAQYEVKNDQHDNFTSLPIVLGGNKIKWLIMCLLFISLFLIFLLLLFQSTHSSIFPAGIILITMSLILFGSFKYKEFLMKNEAYKILAESIFLLPLFMLFT